MTSSARPTAGRRTPPATSSPRLLIGGEIKLRVAGADVTVNGEVAIEALKNNNSFNKAGVSLRDSRPSPEALMRASDRLLDLTGDVVVPGRGRHR